MSLIPLHPAPPLIVILSFLDAQWAVPINTALVIVSMLIARSNRKQIDRHGKRIEKRVEKAEDAAYYAEVKVDVANEKTDRLRKIVDRRKLDKEAQEVE